MTPVTNEPSGTTSAPTATRPPIHPGATLTLVMALVAATFSLYGSFLSELHLAGSPLNLARNEPGLEATRNSKTNRILIQFVAYFLPFGLGVIAAFGGGAAMRAIDQRPRAFSGSLPAVFAILIGGLSAVVSGCMIAALYLWPFIPAIYTT